MYARTQFKSWIHIKCLFFSFLSLLIKTSRVPKAQPMALTKYTVGESNMRVQYERETWEKGVFYSHPCNVKKVTLFQYHHHHRPSTNSSFHLDASNPYNMQSRSQLHKARHCGGLWESTLQKSVRKVAISSMHWALNNEGRHTWI